MDYLIRPLTPTDEPLLWEMLYQALRSHDAETAPAPEIVRRPEFARFVEGWGQEGDAGFVAVDSDQKNRVLGAVWCRGCLAEKGAAPELAFTVTAGHRRRGIGAALLTHWVRANPGQSRVQLRVAPSSPAVRLYERFGFSVVAQSESSVTMQREG
jgi:ribosomal protein S18 acetylase RimI-like enzyme